MLFVFSKSPYKNWLHCTKWYNAENCWVLTWSNWDVFVWFASKNWITFNEAKKIQVV